MNATVTRKIVTEPSNSKCPGASRRVAINDIKFAAAPSDRGTGVARAELPAGPATIVIGGTFNVGSGRTARAERKSVTLPVVVTGDEADTFEGALDGGSQRFVILFTGCRAATEVG